MKDDDAGGPDKKNGPYTMTLEEFKKENPLPTGVRMRHEKVYVDFVMGIKPGEDYTEAETEFWNKIEAEWAEIKKANPDAILDIPAY